MTTEMQQFWETRDRLMRTGSVERMETFLTQWQQKMETKGNFLDWASVTNEKGLFYRKIGLFEESISVMESLRKALLKERGRHSPEYASLLNNLGGTYRKMGDKDTAIALFEESLAIYKAQARLNVSVCASLYLNLSQVYQEKGELEKAAKRLEESLRYFLLSGRQKDVGRVYYQLAFLYYRMDEGDKTDQYIEKALSEFRLHGDRKNPYHEAAAYLLKFYGKTHEYAINRQHEAWALRGMGRIQDAREALLEAGIVCKGLYGKENEKVRAVYDELAMIDKELAEHRERATSAPI